MNKRELTKDNINRALATLWQPCDPQDFMVMAPVPYAMFKATLDNRGRNWRRVKREVRKAAKVARSARQIH